MHPNLKKCLCVTCVFHVQLLKHFEQCTITFPNKTQENYWIWPWEKNENFQQLEGLYDSNIPGLRHYYVRMTKNYIEENCLFLVSRRSVISVCLNKFSLPTIFNCLSTIELRQSYSASIAHLSTINL